MSIRGINATHVLFTLSQQRKLGQTRSLVADPIVSQRLPLALLHGQTRATGQAIGATMRLCMEPPILAQWEDLQTVIRQS